MKRTQFSPLVIHDFEEQTFHLPKHSHTYYEIIYINKGSGTHLLNNNRFNYFTGDLFLISPDDTHHFDIKDSTHFTFIKFTDSYFAGHKLNRPDSLVAAAPEDIMRNKLLKEIKLVMGEPCISILRNTIQNLISYNAFKDIASSLIVYYQILSIFGLVRETMAKLNIRIDNGEPAKEELISYIHHHIYEPKKIKVKCIATHFSIAPSYFSDYFKRKFDISYRRYVNEYRIKLIEKRICATSLTLKQIAAEFGFTDESHLSHYFKTMQGISPMQYRNVKQ